MKTLQDAFPKFLKLESIGKSHDGRDLMLMTVNNPATGPGVGQGRHVHRGQHPRQRDPGRRGLPLHDLVPHGELRPHRRRHPPRRRARLLHHPDGQPRRAAVLHGGPRRQRPVGPRPGRRRQRRPLRRGPARRTSTATASSSRSASTCPGRATTGSAGPNPDILEPVPYGETGDYILLGQEGVDNDGDGLVNEDGPGSYDGNRNWPSDWQPDYVQSGAMDYPFQLPEAKAVGDFLKAHPNIAGVQSYHNSGGMILRGPGAEAVGEYPMTDVRFYDELGRNGERILPFYRYIVLWSGLYTVHGGFIDYTNDGLGILSFSNELWSNDQYFTSPALKEQQADPVEPHRPGPVPLLTSTSTSSSGTSSSSGSPSTTPSSARSRWAASGRSSRAGSRRGS
ncbi:MAG: hypothetical protein MZW92_62175 [Comamonadaceae bacterium]|nr:hypothetical protein [Comamonadaceae bacterium]